MRFLLRLVLLLFACVGASQAEDDPNYLYSLTFQGGMTMTRYAKAEFVQSMRPERPDGVSINWGSSTDDPSDPMARQEIELINQAIASALSAQPKAVLALTSIRGNRTGVWALYTVDGAALAELLEASLKGKTRTPVRIRAGKDPDWRGFMSFLARLQEMK